MLPGRAPEVTRATDGCDLVEIRMSVFRAMQDSQFTDWFLGSDSIWTYPLVLTLHTVGLAALVGASIVVQLRLLGVGPGVPPDRLRVLYRVIWGGFALNLITGLILFVSQAADRAVDKVFYIKLGSIFAALWLGQVAKHFLKDPVVITPTERSRMRIVAVGALTLWTVGIVAGRLVAYFGK
jgi:hypothetical protein